MTHYDVLGVAPTADVREIRTAYVQAARRWHPDRHVTSTAGEQAQARSRMLAVNEAWRVLGDPVARRRYDRTLDAGPPPPWVAPGPGDCDGTDPAWDPAVEHRRGWDDDEWEWAAGGGRVPRRSVLLAPVASLVLTIVLVFGWIVLRFPFLAGLAAITGALTVVLFIAAPLLALVAAKNR